MKRFAFIGAGNMAFAIIGGMKDADITVFDKIKTQYDKFSGKVKIAGSAPEAVKNADYIVFSVKPQNFPELTKEIKDSKVNLDGKTFISIAAGVSCKAICEGLGKDVAVIRTMPNTPLLIGKGVTAFSRNEYVSDRDYTEIMQVFSKSGEVFNLPEEKMNAVIAATSSAPAYIYYIIDCIYKEAINEGLEAPEMLKMICKMVEGSAEMVVKSGKTPEELVKMVTSPKGTTEKAMQVLYEEKINEIIAKAMQKCTERANELEI